MIGNKKIILSMATMPSRKVRLLENLPSIYGQSYDFDILILNINNNVTNEDMDWYNGLTAIYKKMIIVRGDDKWKSCNKLLYALKQYPDDIIITIDDDIYYPKDCIRKLIQQYEITPQCIISHEINPMKIKNGKLSYINGFDIKLKQREWGKYLSSCTLYPPHTFDNTDLYDYDKMMYCTNGNHDELWFWIHSTLNGVQCVGLNYVKTFQYDIKTSWKENEYRLSNINSYQNTIDEYMDKINEMYGEKLLKVIQNKKVVFSLNCDNVMAFLHEWNAIKIIYDYGFDIETNDLTSHWIQYVEHIMNGSIFYY